LIAFLITLLGTGFAFGQNPVANFTANITSGCAPLTVTFTDQSSGSPTAWNWEFSNGTLSSVQNPIVTFSTPGVYSVKLVVQNANGIAEVERLNYITVFPSPAAFFSANLTLACVPSTINFTDQSTPAGSIVSWEWDFGDGGTSTVQNPSHTYTSTGFFTVTLAVTSANGCRNIITRGSYIRIVDGVTTDFSFSQPTTCRGPFTVNFQNLSNGPGVISYAWNFGNGQTSTAQNPSTIYAGAGTYTVTLNTQSDLGCVGSVQKTITITTTTTDFNVPANICLNQPITFQNISSSQPQTSSWDFGDGTTSGQINPIKTFLTPGTFSVNMINQYANCIDSMRKTITVTDRPVVDFTVNDNTACSAPFTVQFTDLSPGAVSWLWDFGDGNTSTLQNPSHQYNNFGNYSVSLTITTAAGCTNTLVQQNYIQISPPTIALNVPAGGCVPFTYTPIATIQTLDPIVSYVWDLGEPGAIFNVANPPPYTYTNPGSYTISLTVTTQSGCVITRTVPAGIKTNTPPTINFSVNPLDDCASTSFSFTDLSTTTGPDVQWFWNFGDGSSSNFQNTTHIFEDTGTLTVTLLLVDNGCPALTTRTVRVRPPIARFTHVFDCTTQQATFTNTSLADPALSPLTYAWDFGNGQTSTLQNPLPVVYVPGTYTVSLTVTNGPCSYTETGTIVIANEPADFTINRNPVCKNEVFTLTAINSNAANIATYEWIVEGVTLPGTGRSVTYSLPNTGTYDVTLTVTDANGCVTTNTIADFITVNGPTANFIPATPGACLNKTMNFTDLSTPAGGISNWNFNFGDGTQQSFTNPPFSHTYSLTGGYIVSLTITDAAGCTDSYTLPSPLLVTNPVVGFRAETFYCPQAPLQFFDTSSGAGLTHFWEFGDGNTSTLQNPLNSYPAGDAEYTVKLRITDISGCQDSVTKTNYIRIRSPKPAFGIEDTTTICPPLRTSFFFQGSDYQSFSWSFGDGGTSQAMNPYYFYGAPGHYIPKLYLYGPGGCVDSAEASVTIYDPNASQINYGPVTTQCNSLNVDFNLVLPPGFKFIFYFGDGSADSSGSTSFSHFYSRPSYNQPILVIQDTAVGCQATIYGTPPIYVLGAIPLFGMNKKESCDTATIVFRDFTTKNEPIISTVWDFGDGTTSNAQEPTHFYTQPGTYIVRLNITTQSNCSSSYADTILIYRTPAPAILSRDTICVNIPDPFNGVIAQPDSVTNWTWNFGNGQTSNVPNNTITYTSAGNFNIQLTTSNLIGCSNTITKTIYVSPPPTAIPVQDPITIISGGNTNLLMNYTGNISSYTWSPVTRLSCTDCAAPLANPQFTTKYTVLLEDRYGCRNSGDITVVVVCNNQNFFVPNTFSPNGDGQNEVFYPRGTGLFRIKSMLVFNRWGQVVFERKNFAVNDPSVGWNGTFKGQKASADVYMYMIEILCDNNTVIPVKGDITLLR
jgi:gliding motility-associated-like protein